MKINNFCTLSLSFTCFLVDKSSVFFTFSEYNEVSYVHDLYNFEIFVYVIIMNTL